MAHMLARLRGSRIEDVRSVPHNDATKHAEQGLHLEYLWQNVDEPEEVLFLFRIDNPTLAKNLLKEFIKRRLSFCQIAIYDLFRGRYG